MNAELTKAIAHNIAKLWIERTEPYITSGSVFKALGNEGIEVASTDTGNEVLDAAFRKSMGIHTIEPRMRVSSGDVVNSLYSLAGAGIIGVRGGGRISFSYALEIVVANLDRLQSW